MASEFLLTITRVDTGERAHLVPDGLGEYDLVEQVVARVLAKGVGVTKTASHVEWAVRESIREVLYAAKAEVAAR